MIPKYHTVPYKGAAVNYENGVYKIPLQPQYTFLTYSEAKRHIDKLEKAGELDNLKLADEIKNQKA